MNLSSHTDGLLIRVQQRRIGFYTQFQKYKVRRGDNYCNICGAYREREAAAQQPQITCLFVCLFVSL